MAKRTIKHEPVIVVWHDAHDDPAGTWVEISQLYKKPYTIESCGYLVKNLKDDHITIIQNLTQDGQVDGIIHIPTAMVVSITSIAPIPLPIEEH